LLAVNFKEILSKRNYEAPTIEVCEPQIKNKATGKYHIYKVVGKDYLGPFEAFRRYSEFDILRKVLYSRFLGLYVPPLPEKKKIVSKS
jgi:hypothetical protein